MPDFSTALFFFLNVINLGSTAEAKASLSHLWDTYIPRTAYILIRISTLGFRWSLVI